MKSPFLQLLARWLVLALGVMLATVIVPGIECRMGKTLVLVVLVLSFFNAVLKPLLVLFTLPFIIVTMGLGMIVINALLLLLASALLKPEFVVPGFWSAVGGSLVISITNLALSGFTKAPKKTREEKRAGRDDVIDI